MVDSIGAKPSVAGDRSVARVAAATPTTAVQTPVQQASSPASAQPSVLSDSLALAKTMASSPPVNATRVAEIKKAIASGTFPILPATIADRLMALSLAWNSNEAA
ncbi:MULTISPECIES: flagellar biosynthesis anti-sigma factor FlgM [unclassified Sphingomonas]|uniref:flagellar biosynthesis anti-sigma factor FlgM n=1 Tax=unclassified Sphingomonas TaxID=196159 RepID=UPI0006F2A29A|nr:MULTISPECIES: flagellar biosynthesis anti-sigma factor FlgM [unclassified Sphingomonas]KQS48319.1 flagellar biosynthesis anti-sigma factor FlgM [Sphingomonas sp. Leaf198]